MNLEILDRIGTVKPVSGCVAAYRARPVDQGRAIVAAAWYAKKWKACMVVIAGNSYGRAVYHIAHHTERLEKYTAMPCKAAVIVVDAEGATFGAIAHSVCRPLIANATEVDA